MSISSELTKLNTNITNAYNAVSGKGGTLPSAQNFDNLATAISSIPSGTTPTGTLSITANGVYDVTNYASADVNVSGGGSKFGASIDTILGNVDANGVLQNPTIQSDLVFTGVEDVADNGLRYKFAYSGVKSASFPALTEVSGQYGCGSAFQQCTGLTSMSLPELTTVSGQYGCGSAFQQCTGLTSVSLPKLTTVSGNYGCYYMFQACSGLTSVSLPELTTVSGNFGCNYMLGGTGLTSISLPKLATVSGNYGCNYMFNNCSELVSVSFPKLADVSGTSTFTGAFGTCRKLTDIYFNALTTTSFGSNVNQFNNIFNSGITGTASTSGNVTVHFPSNLSSTISGLTGYPNFGATAGRVTLAYDLTATS